MSKTTKRFEFTVPVTKKCLINSKLTQVHYGDITVNGVATLYSDDEPDIDYNSIKWNGVDLFELLDNYSPADDFMQSITDAAFTYVKDTYNYQDESEAEKPFVMLDALGKILSHD